MAHELDNKKDGGIDEIPVIEKDRRTLRLIEAAEKVDKPPSAKAPWFGRGASLGASFLVRRHRTGD